MGAAGAFERPATVDLAQMVAGGTDADRAARVAVSADGAGQLRRMAEHEVDGVLTIRFSDPHRLARFIASAGEDATVLEPPDLVDAVIARLRAAAGVSS